MGCVGAQPGKAVLVGECLKGNWCHLRLAGSLQRLETDEVGHKSLQRKGSEMFPGYDIFKKNAAAVIWVEAVVDMEDAKNRAKELARQTEVETEYFVFDQRKQQVVANFNTSRTTLSDK